MKKMSNKMKNLSEIMLAFENIFPKILSDPKEHDLMQLANEISDGDPQVIMLLKEKLIGQMFVIIEANSAKPGVQAKAVKCLAAALDKVKIPDSQHFVRIYDFTCRLICEQRKTSLQKDQPEVLKEDVMLALIVYVQSLTEEALHNLFSDNSNTCHCLSQGILLAVQIAKSEKSMSLRSASLKFLLALSQYETLDTSLRDKVADAFAKVLPGIVQPLADIIAEETTNHSVIVLAQRCWGHFLCLTLCDFPSSEEARPDIDKLNALISQSRSSSVDESSKWLDALKKNERTREWAKAAAGSLHGMIERVSSKFTHPHRLVRLEMSITTGRLLTECSDNLGSHAGPLLDALVSLSRDEDEKVKGNAELCLRSMDHPALWRLSQERLPEVVSQLTTSVRANDTDKINKTMIMLRGYLESFRYSKEGPCVIVNPLLLQKFLPALKSYSRVQVSTELLHQHELEPTDFERYNTYNDEQWKGRTSPEYESICRAVAMYGVEDAAMLLIQDFENGKQPLESLRLLNMIVIHLTEIKPFLRERLLQFYLDVNNSTVKSDPSPKELATAVMKIALSMSGLASLATALDAEFLKHLLQTLYHVVARIGSVYSAVRAAALEAAQVIARVCGAGGVIGLIEGNIDYLTHHIIMRLRRLSEEDVLDATRVVTRFCPAKMLPQLQFIVSQILTSSTDDFRSPHIGPYLRIFLAFVQCAEAAGPPISRTNDKLPDTKTSCGIQLMEYIKKSREADLENEREADVDVEETEATDPSPQKAKPVPKHVDICVKAVSRCLHYLPMCSEMQKVICLEVLDIGLRVVASESEDLLLPLVHQVWSPLVRRFHPSTKPLVISRSFSLLTTLSSLSKSFIRSRTLKEVLPSLRDYLTQSAKISHKQSTTSAFSTTQGYKLQLQLLTKLADLVIDLQLQERDTGLVVEAAVPYLSINQPVPLQERAVDMYLRLLTHDPYFVHFRLSVLQGNDDYAQNICQILKTSDTL